MPGSIRPPLRSPAARVLPLVLALCAGAAAGIGAYTFRYAEGLSYLKTDPKACVNCHIMQPQYDAWQRASHRQVAVCVDCHLPETFFAKYYAKAENGYRHGERFTTQRFVEPIVLQPAGRAIVEANCRRCHADLVHDVIEVATARGARPDELACTHCHFSVGHGEKTGLGGPLRPEERDEP